MNDVSKLDEIEELIKSLIDTICENTDTDITSVTFQIKKINATINELKKNSISVPEELIKLKLSLSDKIDKIKDTERVRVELIKFLDLSTLRLKELVLVKPIKKEKAKKTIIHERVNLIDLINASILPTNVEFYAYYKSSRFSAILTSDGTLEMTVKKKKKVFENPRSAAVAITGYQIEPWKFWKLDFEGKPLTLDDYRNKYFKKKQKDGDETQIDDAELAIKN